MRNPFLYLTLCTIKNRWLMRLRRLRQPRYLIGAIAGALYFFFVFFGPRSRRRRPPPTIPGAGVVPAAGSSPVRQAIEIGGAIGLFLLAALAWLWPGKRPAVLTFSRAEVHFLFPAPFTRRQLVLYRIFRVVVANAFFGLIMTLIARPSTWAGSWMSFIGTTLITSAMSLHGMGVSLTRASLAEHGRSGIARQWLPPLVIVTGAAILGTTAFTHWQAVLAMPALGDRLDEAARLSTTGAAGIVLWPFRALTRLPVSESPAAFLRALPAALAVVAANLVWVLRTDAAFEEASAERAEKVAKAKQGLRPTLKKAKVVSAPFKLAPTGRVETALLWKNLILVGRYASLRTLLRFVPLLVIGGVLLTRSNERLSGAAAAFAMLIGVITLFLGPQVARNDLREDLNNLALIRTWPVSGAALVRGEILAPAAVLSAVVWICIIAAVSLSSGSPSLAKYPASTRAAVAVAAALLGPGIVLTQLVLQNALAVMFPAWVVNPRTRTPGFDTMGQRLIMVYGMMLAAILAMVPAAIIGAAIGFAIYAISGSIPILIPAIAAAITLLVTCWIGTGIVGKILDRTDISSVDPLES